MRANLTLDPRTFTATHSRLLLFDQRGLKDLALRSSAARQTVSEASKPPPLFQLSDVIPNLNALLIQKSLKSSALHDSGPIHGAGQAQLFASSHAFASKPTSTLLVIKLAGTTISSDFIAKHHMCRVESQVFTHLPNTIPRSRKQGFLVISDAATKGGLLDKAMLSQHSSTG